MEDYERDLIIKIAEEEHKKFVDAMYPNFGLEKHPGYCDIIVRPLLAAGAIVDNPLRILLNENETEGKSQR